ncbi:twin-arginine translocation pathway signal [Streptomyces mobaraensis NBRC 13819 = DSM 40847]|uniref:Twin-arginine translocation pathway signal n=2 Tax=Streptomyces mobaraensis TaxID=35621 RepID=M3CDL5_STRM1|nr:twin-arginine translocation pathway signal [Streptomyces mobaraensis NBRC 13819 = DSM 40847]
MFSAASAFPDTGPRDGRAGPPNLPTNDGNGSSSMIDRRSFLVGTGGAALAATALTGAAQAGTGTAGTRWTRLADRLRGRLVLPSDADYRRAKQLYQVQFDAISPQAVAYCASAADVAACVRFARAHGIPVAARSGGHSAGGYSTTRGLVVDVSGLDSVVRGDRSVRIEPGAQFVDIADTLAPAGLGVSAGYCPTVAAGGFFQGGGMGLFTRSIGIASDKVTSAQVVLADGRTVVASPHRHSDLYWALRGGGGGNFGIVTSYEVTPSPLTDVAAVNLVWTFDQALDMLDGWTRWLTDAPWTVGSGVNVTLTDAGPGTVPTAAVFLGSVDTGKAFDDEIARLVSLVGRPPVGRRKFTAPYKSVLMSLYQCSELTVQQCHRSDTSSGGTLQRPAFGAWRSRLFERTMPREGWAAALKAFDASRFPGQMRQLQISALGGRANTVRRDATAYVHRDSLFSVSYLTSNTAGPVPYEAKSAAWEYVDHGFAVIDPYSNGETYQNFIDPRLPDWRRSYYAENYPRLARIKEKYDPYRLFRFAQGVG